MAKFLSTSPYKQFMEPAMLVLRVGLGLLMITHGYPKLEMLLGGEPIRFADPIGIGKTPSLILAVFAELFCAALVVLGLFTRMALIPLIITMLVAVFIVHGNDPIGKKEMGLLYLFGFLAVMAYGSGRFSIDRLMGK